MQSWVEFQGPTEIYTHVNMHICCRCFQVFAEYNYIIIYPSQQGELTAEIITGFFSYAVKRCSATISSR